MNIIEAIDFLISNAEFRRDSLIKSTLDSKPVVLMNGTLTELENSISYVKRLKQLKANVENLSINENIP